MPELMTQPEFDGRREAGELALTLVGMSNVGKSHHSGGLVAEGFDVICCDDQIEDHLRPVLEDAGLEGGIEDMAEWMGQPYDIRFAEAQRSYLDLETKVTGDAILGLRSPRRGNVVIDTTGSVVHTDQTIRTGLAENSLVVYLEASAAMRQEMFKKYIEKPKPVVWGEVFSLANGESPHDALARCYPSLLDFRSCRYGEMAHVAIPVEISHTLRSGSEFLASVRRRLPA